MSEIVFDIIKQSSPDYSAEIAISAIRRMKRLSIEMENDCGVAANLIYDIEETIAEIDIMDHFYPEAKEPLDAIRKELVFIVKSFRDKVKMEF